MILARQSRQAIDPAFRAGFESGEHMALKSALLSRVMAWRKKNPPSVSCTRPRWLLMY
jgi:hypothetical protein